jgi:glucose/arabinose dehydrogenase
MNAVKKPAHAMRRTVLFVVVGSLLAFSSLQITGCKKSDPPPNNNPNATPNLQLVADNLVSPLSVTEAPDGTKRLFIVDQTGKIWIVNADGSKPATPFIDISSKMVSLSPAYDERGLLGFAFHPDFKTNGKFYVFYTAPPRAGGPDAQNAWNNLTRISEFKVSSNSNLADISSERIILEADHPQMNHDGGTIAFGPDGYLYISIGDGGGKDDDDVGHVADWYTANKGGNAQSITANLMGKILRIDVNSGSPYSIPADNPFSGTGVKREIYAFGFRNPYRFAFDMSGTRQLYVGDAGQGLYEEIDVVTKGGNYGWNVKEGTACFNTDNDLLIRPSCPTVDSMGKPLIDPVIQLNNFANPAGGVATVIVAGHVYRGNLLPTFQGKYIFGIFSQDGKANAKLYSSNPSGPGLWSYNEIMLKDYATNLGMFVKGFGQDLSGEIYVTTTGVQGPSGTTGKVYKLVAVP